MPIEIEAKMAAADLGLIRTRLRELDAKLLARYLETNTFFDTADRGLMSADKGLRLRANHNLDTGETRYILTFKGPRQPGALKSRQEVELEVEGAHEATELLECLGYRPILTFEKRRESYDLDDCEVELDELPQIGTFVEIEGPDEDPVMRLRERLGLATEPMIRTGYASMVARYLEERGEKARELRFTH